MTTPRHYFNLALAQIVQSPGLIGGCVALATLSFWVGADYGSNSTQPSSPDVGPSHLKARAWSNSLTVQEPAFWMSQDPQIQERAFMEAIALAEGNADYNELYGHEPFYDLSRHPNACKPVSVAGYEHLCTTAAGRWQITADTWHEYAKRLRIRDFSPEAQYRVALAIARDTGALALLTEGNLRGALRAASQRWAALPHSQTNQGGVSEAQFLRLYERSLMAELKSR